MRASVDERSSTEISTRERKSYVLQYYSVKLKTSTLVSFLYSCLHASCACRVASLPGFEVQGFFLLTKLHFKGVEGKE